jgi:hypothetical protein
MYRISINWASFDARGGIPFICNYHLLQEIKTIDKFIGADAVRSTRYFISCFEKRVFHE